MARSLPARPSVRFLKQEAKDLLRALRQGDRQAARLLRRFPRFAGAPTETIVAADIGLQDVQHALALDYGFAGWADLLDHIDQRLRVGPLQTDDGVQALQWPARVGPGKIRRLYQHFVAGHLDDALLDDVFYALGDRCRALLTVQSAKQGRVICPRCSSVIRRRMQGARSLEELLVCVGCGWRITWGDYVSAYNRKQLNCRNALAPLHVFMEALPRATTPAEKMLAIDTLIHEFHRDLGSGQARRSLAVNLIRGRLAVVAALIESLAYDDNLPPTMRQNRHRWFVGQRQREDWLGEPRQD